MAGSKLLTLLEVDAACVAVAVGLAREGLAASLKGAGKGILALLLVDGSVGLQVEVTVEVLVADGAAEPALPVDVEDLTVLEGGGGVGADGGVLGGSLHRRASLGSVLVLVLVLVKVLSLLVLDAAKEGIDAEAFGGLLTVAAGEGHKVRVVLAW